MKSKLIPIGLACLCASLARAQYNPVTLTPASYTQNIVVAKTNAPPLQNFVNCTIDSGTNDNGNTLCEQGYDPSIPFVGVPPHGATFTSSQIAGHSYIMPPNYITNNVAMVGSANIPGSSPSVLVTQVVSAAFNVVSPSTPYPYLSILYGASGEGANVTVTVSHLDGTVEAPQTISLHDWFHNSSFAYLTYGRVAVDGSGIGNLSHPSGNPTAPALYNADITLSDITSPVTKVAFAYDGTGATANYRFFGLAVSGSSDGANYTPIPVSGFNYDGIIESNAQFRCFYIQGYNVTLDDGPNADANLFYEQGFATVTGGSDPLNVGQNTSTGTTGFPHPGTTLTSGNYSFTLPASYAVNNCVFVGNYPAGNVFNPPYTNNNNYTTGSFLIASPQPYTGFSVLNSAGNGPATLNYTVYYSDGVTSESGSFTSLNWFTADPTLMYNCAGRVSPNGPTINNLNGSPAAAIYRTDITLVNSSLSATNITFTWSSGGRVALFAVSASTDGTHFSPISVTGYDADIIVEKEQPFYHGGLFTATTATMDQGTNNSANTLFERGWVTNGIATGSGMPPAGSTFASLQSATRMYQLQTYSAPNSILVNSVNTKANIAPASPANYSAFALLTAGGNIGTGNSMSNLCILQHADGVNETNFFLGKDWFDTTIPPAFICNGRIDTRNGTCVSESVQGNLNPRLFENFFALSDVGSPVTNIFLWYQTGGGSCYVMAVSATAGAVQPFLGPISVTPASPMIEGSNVVMTCTFGGTAPVTLQWQYSTDDTNWVNLVNGGTFSGATTNTLNISSVGWTNTGYYRVAATNVAGFATTFAPLFIQVYSALADVTQPSDPVVAYQPAGGSSPGGFEVIHAIDNLVGTNDYINFGVNGGASPFVGPVGLVVSPRTGRTVVTAARVYTSGGITADDPANWELDGSNDGGATWATISSGPLALPAARNAIADAAVNPLTQSLQELHFANSTAYSSYRIIFPNTANDSLATQIQIAQVELLGTNAAAAPLITQQPGNVTVWAGASPSFTVVASGYPPPLTYQWSRGTVAPIGPIAGATSSRYTLVNAQLSDSGATFSCVVTDGAGSTPSSSGTLTVSGTKPTASYAVAVMADQPLAYWRLDESDNGSGNNGVIANDYFGGFDGLYTNTVLQKPGYNPSLDSDTAAGFGSDGSSTPDSFVGSIPGIDFTTPTNQSAAFAVEAWVLGSTASIQTSDAGIVTKGYGGGGEQFNLDCGGASHNFRFFVRDVTGSNHGSANGSIGPSTAPGPFPLANGLFSWHHVVGVCDEANSNVVLYVDGISNASVAGVLPGQGVMNSPLPVSIASRTPNIYTDFTNQFNGTIDEVAIYGQALTAAQVLSHYYAAHPLPVFTLEPPAAVDASAGGSLILDASAYGPSITFQWYQSTDGGGTYAPVPGQIYGNYTNNSVAANLTQLYLVATDPYGSTTSSTVNVTVHAGAPAILTDLPATNLVYAGSTATLAVTVYGTAPLSYQWYKSADDITYAPLSDSSHIVGSHSNRLEIINSGSPDIGYYKVDISNGTLPNAESVHEYLIVESYPDFNLNGLGWHLNGDTVNGGPNISTNVFTITDGTAGENRSAWYNFPLYIGAFRASFTYQDIGGNGADGTAFVIQNDPNGTTALGGGGGGMGYNGITPSVALMLNIYSGAPGGAPGYLFTTDGIGPSAALPFTSTTPVNLDTGNPVNVVVTYNGSVLTVNLQDTVASTTFSASVLADIPTIVGGQTAYVGITGAEGGIFSHQTVSNFVFVPLPTLKAQLTRTNTVLLSWPSAIGGYTLQSKADLKDRNPADWTTVGAAVNQVGGQNQVILSPSGQNFYRLYLPPDPN